jgi:hypothetical protein
MMGMQLSTTVKMPDLTQIWVAVIVGESLLLPRLADRFTASMRCDQGQEGRS